MTSLSTINLHSTHLEDDILCVLSSLKPEGKSSEEIVNAVTVSKVISLAEDHRCSSGLAFPSLKYLSKRRPELIQETLYHLSLKDDFNETDLFHMLLLFNACGNRCKRTLPGKEKYSIEEIIKGRYGSIKNDVESCNCEGAYSKIFGQSKKCKALKETQDLIKYSKSVGYK